jgi:DNA-binding response OmpR family regulator
MKSGKSYKPDIDRAIEFGADSYVLKPFSPKELLKIAIKQMRKTYTLKNFSHLSRA